MKREFCEINLFLYEDILDTYVGLFGADHVFPLLFEDLQARPAEYLGQIARIIGVAPLALMKLLF